MIAIKDMNIPRVCYECPIKQHCQIGISDGWRLDKRADDCPLVEIGTCKDCKYNVKGKNVPTMCDRGHRFFMREPSTFYCADFEKRGSENGSN